MDLRLLILLLEGRYYLISKVFGHLGAKTHTNPRQAVRIPLKSVSRWKAKQLTYPPTTLTISQLPQDIRNENVFALYLPINSLPSFPYPRLPSLARSLRSLSLRLRKAKAQNGGEGVSQSRDCPSRRGGVWIR